MLYSNLLQTLAYFPILLSMFVPGARACCMNLRNNSRYLSITDIPILNTISASPRLRFECNKCPTPFCWYVEPLLGGSERGNLLAVMQSDAYLLLNHLAPLTMRMFFVPAYQFCAYVRSALRWNRKKKHDQIRNK